MSSVVDTAVHSLNIVDAGFLGTVVVYIQLAEVHIIRIVAVGIVHIIDFDLNHIIVAICNSICLVHDMDQELVEKYPANKLTVNSVVPLKHFVDLVEDAVLVLVSHVVVPVLMELE